jgi:two-component system sensor histidine kinase HydH
MTFFENVKLYVGFTDQSSAALRRLHPLARPFFVPIVDDFYAAALAHPEARTAITGGAAQIERLKRELSRWIDELLLGPHDEAYYERRARIGRAHVRIGLPQRYLVTAMDRIRVRLLDVVRAQVGEPSVAHETATALDQLIDLELAVMLETYREDLVERNRRTERLATLGQLAASIGHELRNPLGVVESSLYLLRQHLGEALAQSPQVAKHLDRIDVEIKRATHTVGGVLDLARDRPPQRRPTELRLLVEAAAEAASLPPAVTFHSSVPAGLTANLDFEQMRQVLINLFDNSAQALLDRGHVWVEGASSPDGGAWLRVRDDGPGIPSGDRRRLFEALFTTKAKGSGLGLALCRRIVEAHGGSIESEDTPSGASFLLTVPPA